MPGVDFKRKLAAILHADVKGYSRLIGEDEETTVATLRIYRETMGLVIRKHRGRVVHGSGDSLLAEFVSVVDAVRSAVEIQEELQARNAQLPENRRVEFRIGINLGDVIEEGEDLHGDGVNIAARIESLADPGGICIASGAYDQVKKKLALGYEYLGEHTVKNIAEPVRVYKVITDPEAVGKVIGEKSVVPAKGRRAFLAAGIVLLLIVGGVLTWRAAFPPVPVASVEKMAFPLPDKPSIAVLPFNNMSGDPEQEYFSDGLTEELITALSKIPQLFVIARNSTFTYKGKPVRVRQVSEELGVQYVLEGSVRKAGDEVRITAQLIDALSGNHLWAERYDRNLKGIFAVQDVWLQTSKSPKDSIAKAIELLQKAIVLDDTHAEAHGYLGFLYSMTGRHDEAIAEGEKAVALNPNSAGCHFLLGKILTFAGKWEESIPEYKIAIRLNPIPPISYLHSIGLAYAWTGQYDQAITWSEKAIRQEPNSLLAHLFMASVCSQSGRDEEARIEAAEVLRINPKFSLEKFAKSLTYKNQEDVERQLNALRKAGLK